MKEIEPVPDWSETPLRKNKELRALVTQRGSISANMKAEKAELGKLNLAIFSAFTSAKVDKARVDAYGVTIVTPEETEKTDEGLFIRFLVEDAGVSIEKVMKAKKKATKKVKRSPYVLITGGDDDGDE